MRLSPTLRSHYHHHYRHPQVLILDWQGLWVEFIGLHLKSKFINNGESQWKAGGSAREQVQNG